MAIETRGTLYCGDCLEVMEKRIAKESVDLIYADPPFFTNRKYEVIWGDEGEVRSFEDRWEGGIEVYAAWMTERLRACHRVLKPTGSMYLHCDWHASHHLRLALDTVFGRENFLNNIVWLYGLGGSSPRYWPRKHDDILWYSKQPDKHYFNAPMTPAKSVRMRGQMKKVVDYWDIPSINNMAKERVGYPTQKPEALLERIVQSSSRKQDTILDPFCGCGTALVVAERLGRRWIGIDVSPTATRVIKTRLGAAGSKEVEMISLPTTVAEIRALEPFEFQNWVVRDRFNGVVGPRGGDKGIDGYSFMVHDPIQVKQSDGVGRNVVDNFHAAIRRAGKKKGWLVALGFGKGAHEEAARVKREDKIEIVLLTVEELLSKPPG